MMDEIMARRTYIEGRVARLKEKNEKKKRGCKTNFCSVPATAFVCVWGGRGLVVCLSRTLSSLALSLARLSRHR